jgi:hypothetical protein
MQNFISTFSPSRSFQFVNEQLSSERGSPHRHDCHDPPHAPRMGGHDDRSPPRRLAAVARSGPWNTGRSGDYLRRIDGTKIAIPRWRFLPPLRWTRA